MDVPSVEAPAFAGMMVVVWNGGFRGWVLVVWVFPPRRAYPAGSPLYFPSERGREMGCSRPFRFAKGAQGRVTDSPLPVGEG